MKSPASLLPATRRRDLVLTSTFVALVLAGLVAARGLGGSCPAQAEAIRQAQPGMVLMAGDVTNPACTGKQRTRSK